MATAVSKHAGFHLQVHTRAHGRKEEREKRGEKKVVIPLIEKSAHSGPTEPLNPEYMQLQTSQKYRDRTSRACVVPLIHCTHSITCIALCTAEVFSLTKSDLANPICGV